MITLGAQDVVVVTGATRGIGRAIAGRLHGLGASIIAVGRKEADLAQLSSSLGSRVTTSVRDFAEDHDGIDGWFSDLSQRAGPITGVVHAAGVLASAPLRVVNLAAARKLMAVNWFAGWALAQAFARVDGEGANRSMLVISSVSGERGLPASSVYCASKSALNSMVRAAACELAERGARCNAIMPGMVETDMTRSVPRAQVDMLVGQQFLPGFIQPDDVAALAAFLMSPAARLITGQCIALDAGGGLQTWPHREKSEAP